MKLNDDESITSGIPFNIRKGIDKTLERGNLETFQQLEKFIRRVLSTSIKENSLKTFKEFIFFPAAYYSVSFHKSRKNPTNSLHSYCTEHSAMHLKELVSQIEFSRRGLTSAAERKHTSEFFYWAFNGFNRLLYYVVRQLDAPALKTVVNEYDMLSNRFSNFRFERTFRIRQLKLAGSNQNELEQLEELHSFEESYNRFYRHVLLGIRYWILYLVSEKKIDTTVAIDFLTQIRIGRIDSDEVLDDVLFFRKLPHGYFEWDDWDHEIRQSGKVYSPPDPFRWMTLGFMADQIIAGHFSININELEEKNADEIRFLFDELTRLSKYFEEEFDTWKDVLKVNSVSDLKEKTAQILSTFSALKRKSVGSKERAIAKQPLSPVRIEQFVEKVGESWLSFNDIHRTFKFYGNVELVNAKNADIRPIGQSSFLTQGKMLFLDGELYQYIFGIEDLGGVIARAEDSKFISVAIRERADVIYNATFIETLDTCIADIKVGSDHPTAIIISIYQAYDDDLYRSHLFISKDRGAKLKYEGRNYIGDYDGIPIFTSISENIKNKIIVADFQNAFLLKCGTDPTWFQNELKVVVTEVNDEIARNKFNQNPSGWKHNEAGELTEAEAITLIKTSVIVDIEAYIEFRVLDRSKYRIGVISQKQLSPME